MREQAPERLRREAVRGYGANETVERAKRSAVWRKTWLGFLGV